MFFTKWYGSSLIVIFFFIVYMTPFVNYIYFLIDWDFTLQNLCVNNDVKLVWVSGCEGIAGNDVAYELVRKGAK